MINGSEEASLSDAFPFLPNKRVSKNTSARTVARTFKISKARNSGVQLVLSLRKWSVVRRMIIISCTSIIPSVPSIERTSKMVRVRLSRRSRIIATANEKGADNRPISASGM